MPIYIYTSAIQLARLVATQLFHNDDVSLSVLGYYLIIYTRYYCYLTDDDYPMLINLTGLSVVKNGSLVCVSTYSFQCLFIYRIYSAVCV